MSQLACGRAADPITALCVDHDFVESRDDPGSTLPQRDHRIDLRRPPGRQVTGQRRDRQEQPRHADEDDRIVGADPEQQALEIPTEREGPGQAKHDAYPCRSETLGQDQRKNRCAVGAERLANAELAHALRDTEGQNAIDADAREDQGNSPKQAEQSHGRFPGLKRSRDPLIHRPDVGDRLLRIDRSDRGTNGRYQRLRIEPGFEDQRHAPGSDLRRRGSTAAPS